MKSSALFALILACAVPTFGIAREADAQVPSQGPSGVALLVPAGTAVPVQVVGSVSSGSAKVGDVFQIQVVEVVIVSDMVVFRKGAQGQRRITSSDSAGGNGHSGAISLAFDYVYAADGGRVKLSNAPQNDGRRSQSINTANPIGSGIDWRHEIALAAPAAGLHGGADRASVTQCARDRISLRER